MTPTRVRADRTSTPRLPTPWPFLAIAFVLGLGAGFLFWGATQLPTARDAAPSPTAAPPPTTVPGIGALIPGFQEGVVAVVQDGSGFDLLNWPVAGSPHRTGLPAGAVTAARGGVTFGWFAAFDDPGLHVALAMPGADRSRATLLAGRAEAPVIVATNVTSFAWHRSAAHWLAFTQEREDGTWLMTIRGGAFAPSAEMALEHGQRVVAWTSDGFGLIGEDAWSLGASQGTGWLRAASDKLIVHEDDEGVWITLRSSGSVTPLSGSLAGSASMSVSPNDRYLATRNGLGTAVTIIDLVNDASTTIEARTRGALTWSSDSRFVLAPAVRGVTVIEAESGLSWTIGTDRVFAVAARPIPSPSPRT